MKEIEIYTKGYFPFVMGGDVWQKIRTKAKPEQVIELRGFKVGIFRNPCVEQYHACLMEGGAMIGTAMNDAAVIKQVSEDIETGDIEIMKKQVKQSLEEVKQARYEKPEDFFGKFRECLENNGSICKSSKHDR